MATKLSEGASVYIASGEGGIKENDKMEEQQLTDGKELRITYPAASVYITVKASNVVLDSNFTLEVYFSPTSS